MALTVGPLHAELAQQDDELQVYTRAAGKPNAMLGQRRWRGAPSDGFHAQADYQGAMIRTQPPIAWAASDMILRVPAMSVRHC
jgi:hypothetical protein